MYSKKCELTLKASASHSTRNLFSWSCGQKSTIVYVNQASLRYTSFNGSDFTTATNTDFFLANPNSIVLQAKVVTVSGGLQVLVIITEGNIQFHDIRGTCVLFTYIPDRATESTDGKETKLWSLPIAKGIASLGDTVLIGCQDGSILAFGVWSSSLQVTFEKNINGHDVPISDLFSDSKRLVSCDINGNIFLWEGTKRKIVLRFEGFNGFPATSVLLRDDIICAAYGSGHIRVFSISKKRLLSEVAAHSHSINFVCMYVSTLFQLECVNIHHYLAT